LSFEISLSPFQQRIAAIALAVIPILGVLAGLYSVALGLVQHHERIALLKRERANYQALIDMEPQWRKELLALELQSAGTSLFFANTQVANAAGLLNTTITNIVTSDHGSILRSSQSVQSASDGGPNELRESISIAVKNADLVRILYDMRQARPLLFPVIVSIASPTAGPIRSDLPNSPNRLSVDLTIAAYMASR
jgi:hypothetical protein